MTSQQRMRGAIQPMSRTAQAVMLVSISGPERCQFGTEHLKAAEVLVRVR
jgi:hypothetical protein